MVFAPRIFIKSLPTGATIGNFSPQNLQTIASCLIISAQNEQTLVFEPKIFFQD